MWQDLLVTYVRFLRLILTLSEPACFLSWFSSLLLIASCQQPRFPFPGWFRWTQPERDMGWLHRLLHHRQQALAQLVQVHLVAQGGTESGQGLSGVILAAVETPVNNPLDALAERLEQNVDRQRGEDNSHAVVLADDATQERLQANHQAHVNHRQDNSQRAIYKRAIDKHINIPQPVAQHSEPKRERDQEPQAGDDGAYGELIERPGRRIGVSERWEDQRGHFSPKSERDEHGQNEYHPLGLLTLQWTGHAPVAVNLHEHKHRQFSQKHQHYKPAKRCSERERRKESVRDKPCEQHDEAPAHPMWHELPAGKQEEDEHEQGSRKEK